jgi:hypothetical protein
MARINALLRRLDFTGNGFPSPTPIKAAAGGARVWAAVAVLGCAALTLWFQVSPAGSDSELYSGLADNLLSGRGYVDTVRNDEIITPIGHPLVLAATKIIGLSDGLRERLFLFISLLLVFHTGLSLSRSYVFGLAMAGAFALASHRQFIAGGIESSIVLMNTLLAWALFRAISSQRRRDLLPVGVAALGAILVRPALLGASVLLLFIVLGRTILDRVNARAAWLFPFAVLFGGLAAAAGLSHWQYGDLRYISGTYGSIPVYCAFNQHIGLTQPYSSDLWAGIPAGRRMDALAALSGQNGWAARERALKVRIREFVFTHPGRAVQGVLWRARIYSYGNPSGRYRIFLLASLAAFVVLLFGRFPAESRLMGVVCFLLGVWILMMKLFFVYTDNRNTIDIMPFLFYPLLLVASLSYLKARSFCQSHTVRRKAHE